LREAALQALALGTHPVCWEIEGSRAFINIVRPPERLVVLGTTLVAESLCELASRAGFQVTLVDDTGYASPERYPGVAAIVRDRDPVEALLGLEPTPATSVVLMSVGHRLDMPAAQPYRPGIRLGPSHGPGGGVKATLANRASTRRHLTQRAGRVIVLRSTSNNSAPRRCIERVKVYDDKEDERWRSVLVMPSKVL
jgi:XdhC Rossmann domain